MTARPQDVALLPDLDEWLRGCPDPSKVSPEWLVKKPSRLLWRCRDALASAQAREDELRAELIRIERENREGWKQAAHWRGRAERLAEALRGWWEMKRPLKWSEAQHRETPCVNCATEAEYRLAKLAALSTNAATQPGETT